MKNAYDYQFTIKVDGQEYTVEADQKHSDDIRRRFHVVHHDFQVIPMPDEARTGGPSNPVYKAYKKAYRKAFAPILQAMAMALRARAFIGTGPDLCATRPVTARAYAARSLRSLSGDKWKWNAKAGCSTCRCSPGFEQQVELNGTAFKIWISKK
jgi:hypothetical protein